MNHYIIKVYTNVNIYIKKWGGFMKIIGEIVKSFTKLGVGMIFIDLILLVLIIVLVKCIKIKKVYEDFSKQLRLYDGDEKIYNKNDFLKSIIDSFIRAVESGITKINLKAIINKNLDKSLISGEKNIKIYSFLIKVLGVIGTFLVIMTTAIEYEKVVISQIVISFWPIVFVLIADFLLKIVNIIIIKRREEFYFLLEDFLENDIYSLYREKQNIEITKISDLEKKIEDLEKVIEKSSSNSQKASIILNDSTNKIRYNFNLLHSDLLKVHELLRKRW